jgi:hypothetical protein
MSSVDLEQLLARVGGLGDLPLREQLQWLEDTAAAAERADLGDAGDDAALQLRAALGAIVKLSQTASPTPEQLAEGQLVIRTLMARGTLALTRALAETWRALAHEKHPQRTACMAVADAFDDVARAVQQGRPIPADVVARLRAVDAGLKAG